MKQQQQPGVHRQIDVVERKTPPILSGILGFMVLLGYYFYRSSHNITWINEHTFQASRFIDFYTSHQYANIGKMLFMANFATINIWQLLLSIYFLCVFSIPVEKRLGPIRFIGLVVLAGTIPWIIQFWDVICNPVWPMAFEHSKLNTYFFGPSFITLVFASAYMVLVPTKEKDKTQSRLYRKDRTEIFNRTETKSVAERFGLAPNLFFSAVIAYVYIQRFVMIYLFSDYDTVGFYSGLSALFIGFCLSSFIHAGLEDTFQEHPLKHAAIKQYYELLDLDVEHINAVRGAAKGLGLPDYQVEEWVKKSKGKLRPM